MTAPHPTQDNVQERRALFREWLSRRLSADALAWLDQQIDAVVQAEKPLQLGIAIGLAPRKLGKADLDLTAEEQATARAVREDLDLTGWSVDQAGRALFVLASYRGDEADFARGLDRIFANAEIGEQIALLRALPLFPAPALLLPRALEGVRNAMQPIFEAIAHRNPFPREQFSEAQWNQMVVKTLFIGSRLAPIQGLDARRNADLAQMLIDYADERRAAGRSISPELWRCVAPFAGDAEIATLKDILAHGSETEAAGAALALAECEAPAARAALNARQDLAVAIESGRLTWNSL
ncbi:EboA domain-containing protein [Hyphomicrobium sp.]|uniref:EboA domain-containing protein n=1 Tax=Hyphomicrobium sp. TaxID=82 RepID=UPI002E366BEF|nr:EboA domain-containing protein [Hyphomicrobium sp.]HEX2841077.1 EboA domain-containing protein [Hyphomicrobium sp.]